MRYKVEFNDTIIVSRDEVLEYFQLDMDEWSALTEDERLEHIKEYAEDRIEGINTTVNLA